MPLRDGTLRVVTHETTVDDRRRRPERLPCGQLAEGPGRGVQCSDDGSPAKIRSVNDPSHRQDVGVSEPGESDVERVNRNLTELLGELRVAIPGVQVLFAFLLAVPFSQRFASVGPFERLVYLVTLLLTAIASALLIAPSVYHRIEFGFHDRSHVVTIAHRLTLAGFAFLALAMTSAVLLVTRYLFSVTTTIIVVSLVLAMFGTLWFALPFSRRRALRRGLSG